MCSYLFIFSQQLPTIFFLHLFIFFLTLQLLFLSTKSYIPFSFFLTIWSFPLQSLWKSLSPKTSSWHPSPRKPPMCSQATPSTSHPLEWGSKAARVSFLDIWVGGSPFCKCLGQIGDFFLFFFSHFLIFLLSSVLICFWTCKCLSFVVGWV